MLRCSSQTNSTYAKYAVALVTSSSLASLALFFREGVRDAAGHPCKSIPRPAFSRQPFAVGGRQTVSKMSRKTANGMEKPQQPHN